MPRAIFDENGVFVDFPGEHEIRRGEVVNEEQEGMGAWHFEAVNIGNERIPQADWDRFNANFPEGQPVAVWDLVIRNIPRDGNPDDEDEWVHEPPVAAPRGINFGEMAVAPAAGIQPRKERMENGPDLWKFLLGNIQEVYGCDAVIAGGAVRDHFLGIPINDVDIFIDHNFPEVVRDAMPELNFGPGMNASDPQYQQSDAEIKGVWEFWDVKGNKINLIARPIPKQDYPKPLLDTFDFNICKSAFYIDAGGNPTLYDDPMAAVDRGLKTFTYVGSDTEASKLKSKARFQKFISRTKLDFKLEMHDIEDILKRKKEAEEKRRAELAKMSGNKYTGSSTATTKSFKYYLNADIEAAPMAPPMNWNNINEILQRPAGRNIRIEE